MNAVVAEIDAKIWKAVTIFAFSVYSCKERSEKYFRRNIPPCFHFYVSFVCRFYFVVWKGNRQRIRMCHVTSTSGSYVRATELSRWPHTHNCHVASYIFDTGLAHWPRAHLPVANVHEAVLCYDLEKNGMARAWHGRCMASVNQTRPHCLNQMGKTHSKPLAARHGRGTAWTRRAMSESAFTHLQQATHWPRTHLPQASLLASYIATGRTQWPCTHSLPQDKPVGVIST